MKVLPGNASHIGSRHEQQDAFALSDFADSAFIKHGGYLAVVADGIGGLKHGAEAANRAVSYFLSSYLNKSELIPISTALDIALESAQQAVLDCARQLDCIENMGSTLVAALIHQDQLYWRAVGDSHLYLCRDGRLSQLNVDHNFAQQLQIHVEAGLISQIQADNHPERYALEYFIGFTPLPPILHHQQPITLKPGDRLLLCSDGIDDFLSEDAIIACLSESPMNAAKRLSDEVLALHHPYQDNLTAVVLAYC